MTKEEAIKITAKIGRDMERLRAAVANLTMGISAARRGLSESKNRLTKKLQP